MRSAFNQVKTLLEHDFGKNGEYVGLDVKAMRTQRIDMCYKHLENSMKIVRIMEEKAGKFDQAYCDACIEVRDYEALEMYVVDLLLNK